MKVRNDQFHVYFFICGESEIIGLTVLLRILMLLSGCNVGPLSISLTTGMVAVGQSGSLPLVSPLLRWWEC